jgi:hypothetical protein
MIKNAEAGDVLYFIVLLILTVVALSAGHLLGGLGIRRSCSLAMTSAKRQVWIAMLIAGINIPGSVTIDVIVIYPTIASLATIPYTKWCKKQLVTQVKP